MDRKFLTVVLNGIICGMKEIYNDIPEQDFYFFEERDIDNLKGKIKEIKRLCNNIDKMLDRQQGKIK